jgi:hypothetical protein
LHNKKSPSCRNRANEKDFHHRAADAILYRKPITGFSFISYIPSYDTLRTIFTLAVVFQFERRRDKPAAHRPYCNHIIRNAVFQEECE